MTQNTLKHFDECVQFWIDLIQIRAPGSTIIVVGTKSDLISEPSEIQQIIASLRKRLDDNEKLRISSIKKERKKSPLLQRLLKQRPITRILPVSCTASLSGFNELTKVILELSTPTSKNPNPFQLVNIEIPRYYLEVKEEVESMLQTCSVTNMEQLHQNMKEKRKNVSHLKDRVSGDTSMSINDTRDAVTFLSSIGEVDPLPLVPSSILRDLPLLAALGCMVWISPSEFSPKSKEQGYRNE
jgi:GTPase SAR1 family protein